MRVVRADLGLVEIRYERIDLGVTPGGVGSMLRERFLACEPLHGQHGVGASSSRATMHSSTASDRALAWVQRAKSLPLLPGLVVSLSPLPGWLGSITKILFCGCGVG